MADEAKVDVEDPSKDPESDKTDEINELKKAVDDIPSEDDLEGDRKKEPEKKIDRSEIAQKIKYREQLKETRSELAEANKKIADLEKRIGTPAEKTGDDKELAAQKYIRDLARTEAENILKEREDAEKKEIREFEENVSDILEDNPEISKDRLLEVIEEFDVSPKTAADIIGKWNEGQEKKPKMPAPKRAAPQIPSKKHNDEGKSFHQVAQDVIREIREKIIG